MRQCQMFLMVILLLVRGRILLGEDHSMEDQIRTAVLQATESSAPQYPAARKRLRDLAQMCPGVLDKIRASTNAWDVQTMCAITLEAVQKEGAIRKLLQWQPEKFYSRALMEEVKHYGDMLASEAKETPLFLVEKIWKDNELNFLCDKDKQTACVAYALGALQVQEARRPLELLLKQAAPMTVMPVALAIGRLKNPDSVEPLLDVLVGTFQGANEVWYVPVAEALAQCARKESLPVLNEALRKIENGELKDRDNKLKSFLKLLIMSVSK